MAWLEADPFTRQLIGPGAAAKDLTEALTLDRPAGCSSSPSGFHELDGPGVRWIRQLPGGGTAWCLFCGAASFVGPETCLERLDLEEISATFLASDLLEHGRDAKPVRPPS